MVLRAGKKSSNGCRGQAGRPASIEKRGVDGRLGKRWVRATGARAEGKEGPIVNRVADAMQRAVAENEIAATRVATPEQTPAIPAEIFLQGTGAAGGDRVVDVGVSLVLDRRVDR